MTAAARTQQADMPFSDIMTKLRRSWRNGERLHLSHLMKTAGSGWRRHFTTVLKDVPNDATLQVRAHCHGATTSHCWHSSDTTYTVLTVHRLPSYDGLPPIVGLFGPQAHDSGTRDGKYHVVPLDSPSTFLQRTFCTSESRLNVHGRILIAAYCSLCNSMTRQPQRHLKP